MHTWHPRTTGTGFRRPGNRAVDGMPWFMTGWTVLLSAGRLPDGHSIWARGRRINGHSAGAQHQSPRHAHCPMGSLTSFFVGLIGKVRPVEIDADFSERPDANRCATVHRNVGPRDQP